MELKAALEKIADLSVGDGCSDEIKLHGRMGIAIEALQKYESKK